jgi:uncharacterized protein
MTLDVNEIKKHGFLLEDSLDPDDSLLIEDDSFFNDAIRFSIRFNKLENSKIKAKGWVRTHIFLRCVKCLEMFDYKINSNFDIVFFPAELSGFESSSLKGDDLEYIFYEDNEIDLKRVLLEQINLFIPVNPVCDSDCKGICPNCGSNLNKEKCKCENPVKDVNLLFDKLKG